MNALNWAGAFLTWWIPLTLVIGALSALLATAQGRELDLNRHLTRGAKGGAAVMAGLWGGPAVAYYLGEDVTIGLAAMLLGWHGVRWAQRRQNRLIAQHHEQWTEDQL